MKHWKTTMRQFDIWLADLNPSYGTEPGKIRPVVIIQNNTIIAEGHKSTLICPLTSKVTAGTRIMRINVRASVTGVLQDSDIMMDQIRAIDNKRLVRRIGILDDDTIDRVKQSLTYIFDLMD